MITSSFILFDTLIVNLAAIWLDTAKVVELRVVCFAEPN